MSLWLLLQILLILPLIPFCLLGSYLLLLTIAAWFNPERKLIHGRFEKPRNPQARFIILIPAHNEELLIGDVIGKLRKQSYPATNYQIVIIADNCDDKTAKISREMGATTLERQEAEKRGKGQALNWAIRGPLATWSSHWDALIIIDADSVLNPDFLWFMNERLQEGCQAMQAYYGVQNPADSWRTSLMDAAFSAIHFVRPLGRDKFGLPCGLKGNGMCFSRAIVEKFGYPATSVVEDVELALIYLRQGIGVKFTPGAQVFGQMASTTGQADTQRKRWEGGRLSLILEWALPLWREGWREKNLSKIDGALDLFVPPLALIFLPVIFFWLIMLIILLLHFTMLGVITFLLWNATLLSIILYLATGLVLIKAPLSVWLRLVAVPLFIFWKIAVYLEMGYKDKKTPTKWVRTERHKMK